MEFLVQKDLKGPEAVRAHEKFGNAVFVECGLHEPQNFCYDHHSMGGQTQWSLSSAGMLQQDLLQRRRLPNAMVMNHVRHLDNLVALYLLYFRGFALTTDTSKIVAAADLMDRVGPLAIASLPSIERSVLETAQSVIPFKEWEVADEELRNMAIKAVESLRNMVTTPIKTARYQEIFASDDGKFIIVQSDEVLGNTLYDQGYDAYAAVTSSVSGIAKWTFARASEYVPFNIPKAIADLNELENCAPGKGWGGRSVIAGSPQPAGTKLAIEVVVDVVKKHYIS